MLNLTELPLFEYSIYNTQQDFIVSKFEEEYEIRFVI